MRPSGIWVHVTAAAAAAAGCCWPLLLLLLRVMMLTHKLLGKPGTAGCVYLITPVCHVTAQYSGTLVAQHTWDSRLCGS